jgi:hypothetical protein
MRLFRNVNQRTVDVEEDGRVQGDRFYHRRQMVDQVFVINLALMCFRLTLTHHRGLVDRARDNNNFKLGYGVNGEVMSVFYEILLAWLAFIVLTIAFFRGATLGESGTVQARPAAARPAEPPAALPAKKIVRLIG